MPEPERAIFIAALDLDGRRQRQSYVETACDGDSALLRRVRELLESHFQAGEFLTEPAALDATVAEDVHDFVAGLRNAANASLQPVMPADHAVLGSLGDYRVIRIIGSGGMGAVYEAVQQSLGRRVALKVMSPHLSSASHAVERFACEVRSAARLHHTNIIPVFDVGEHRGCFFYAMQFIDGAGLDVVIDRLRQTAGVQTRSSDKKNPAPVQGSAPDEIPRPAVYANDDYWQWAARLGWQVADALAYAHRERVLHRDIKPANLLIDRGDTAWIADFGLAKVDESDLTQTGEFVGTLRFAAPERLHGVSHEQGDVYSLGATLYEVLTLKPAFDELDRAGLLGQIDRVEPPSPRRIDARIPIDLETIVVKAMAKRPVDRYATASAMRDDLELFLTGQPIRSRRIGRIESAMRWCRRNPLVAALVAGLGTASILLVLSIILVSSARRREQLVATSNVELLTKEREARAREASALERERTARVRTLELAREQRLRTVRQMYDGAGDDFQRGDIGQSLLTHAQALSMLELALPEDTTTLSRWSPAATALAVSCRRQIGAAALASVVPAAVIRHNGAVEWVEFSPDGRLLATGSKDGAARLWNTRTALPVGPAMTHESWVNAACFTSDGAQLVTAANDGTCRFWNTGTGQPTGTTLQLEGPAACLCVQPGHDHTIATAEWSGAIRLWNVAHREPHNELLQPAGSNVRKICFSPDGTRLAAGFWNGTAMIWTVETRKGLDAPLQHRGAVAALCFSPDGRKLATGSHDRTVQVWDASTGAAIGEPLIHDSALASIAFSPDGRLLATGAESQRVQFWQLPTGAKLPRVLRHRGTVGVMRFSPTDDLLATGSEDQTARLWDVSGLVRGAVKIDLGQRVAAAEFSPDGSLAAMACADGVVRLGEATTLKPVGAELKHSASAQCVRFSPDGSQLATGSVDKTAQVWDVATRRPVGKPIYHGATVTAIAFSPDGRVVATASEDYSAQLTRVSDSQPATPPLKHLGMVSCVVFSPDGRLVATGSEDQTVRLWNADDGSSFGEPLRLQGWVQGLAFSPDGSHLATACWDHSAQVWEVASGRPAGSPLPHAQKVSCVRFSPDGQLLATACWDGACRLWEVASGSELGEPRRHEGIVTSVEFAPNGQSLMTASDDGTVRFWPVPVKASADAGRLLRWAQWLNSAELDELGNRTPRTIEAAAEQAGILWQEGGPPPEWAEFRAKLRP